MSKEAAEVHCLMSANMSRYNSSIALERQELRKRLKDNDDDGQHECERKIFNFRRLRAVMKRVKNSAASS
jgi:hypothetical protein